MVTRFRYTSRAGDEFELKDLKELEVHVASGRITDDTLLFDTLTAEFAPAREHDAYRFVVEELDGVTLGRSREPEELPDLGVTLAEESEPESSEAFVERLRREREDDLGAPGWLAASHRAQGNPSLVEEDAAEGEAAPAEEAAVRAEAGAAAAAEAAADPEDRRMEVPSWDRPLRGQRPPRRPRRYAGSRRAPRAFPWFGEAERGASPSRAGDDGVRPLRTAGLAAVLLGVAYLALWAQPGAAPEANAPAVASLPVPRPPASAEAPVPLDPVNALAASEDAAFQEMVEAMDSLARVHRVFQVPAVWLEGEYLADASAHPEVGAYWVRYLVFVRKLRREDARLYRRSFVTRLTDLEVSPAVVSLRLAQAVERFDDTQGLRDGMYDRMEDLAQAGIDFHRLLVERDEDIEYVPPERAFAATDPFLQIRTDDAALQERIYQLLDRMFEDLEAIHGETRWTRDALNDGVLSSIRSTAGPRGGKPAGGGGAPERDGVSSGGR